MSEQLYRRVGEPARVVGTCRYEPVEPTDRICWKHGATEYDETECWSHDIFDLKDACEWGYVVRVEQENSDE